MKTFKIFIEARKKEPPIGAVVKAFGIPANDLSAFFGAREVEGVYMGSWQILSASGKKRIPIDSTRPFSVVSSPTDKNIKRAEFMASKVKKSETMRTDARAREDQKFIDGSKTIISYFEKKLKLKRKANGNQLSYVLDVRKSKQALTSVIDGLKKKFKYVIKDPNRFGMTLQSSNSPQIIVGVHDADRDKEGNATKVHLTFNVHPSALHGTK